MPERAVREITAKTLLLTVRQPDTWFGLKYNLNLYRGCQHGCIYCDSRSACYGIDGFDSEVLVKTNALELLDGELSRKRVIGTIGTGSMNDPYQPLEAKRRLTRRALEIIARHKFPVHVLTKSTLVLRDTELLQEIGRVYSAVSFTITAFEDDLSRVIEPGAPPSSARFEAMEKLAVAGIYTGMLLMPVLPFITDGEENLRALLERAAGAGAGYVIASFGVTQRDRQRAYFYDRLDEYFPGLRARYERAFGERYTCLPPHAQRLRRRCTELCSRLGLAEQIRPYRAVKFNQMDLFSAKDG